MQPHILIVDDEESIRYTFEAFLSEEGYTVSSAADYEEGIALLREKDVDLIFADIILPGKSGIDLLKAAREIVPGVPVIMITGAPSVDTATESLRIGAFDYIVKPIRQQSLMRSVNIALKHKAVKDESEQCRLNFEAIFRSVNDGIITVTRTWRWRRSTPPPRSSVNLNGRRPSANPCRNSRIAARATAWVP